MIDEILAAGVIRVVAYIARIVFFPVALIICTPAILIRAAILVLRHRQRFVHAISDGYSIVDVFWWA